MSETDWLSKARAWLLKLPGLAGGLGYYPGSIPFLEPTVLGLKCGLEGLDPALLSSFLRPDGGFAASPAFAGSSWMSWSVPLVLDRLPPPFLAQVQEPLATWFLNRFDDVIPGQNFSEKDLKEIRDGFKMDVALDGWPWVEKTASWVEPTALNLIALHLLGKGGHARVATGIKMLWDRQCQDGGWNYGNPYQLGTERPGHNQETLVVLTVLRLLGADRENPPGFKKGLDFLDSRLFARPSTPALAWALVLRRLLALETRFVIQALIESQDADGSWMGDVFKTLLVLAAAGDPGLF